ncbi:MAG: sterol desaturase family protein [Nannocystis sp.]|uniref:sterol desaturase family protein n=1 Tax=Nannocystis sp. TaxID=1962667 RepID=UPI0024248C33|nr:sterol desaturase family protein [Nannocystis sp.]MBK9752427.1 sterol desaturase family protein [Nannocystis sp.]
MPPAPAPAHPVLTDELLALALGPEPPPSLEARAPRCFHSAALERLVRAHPASPYLLHLPLLGLYLWRAHTDGLTPAALLLSLVAGWLMWTLVEYWLHRAFFHMRPSSPARRITSFIVHRHHHVAPNDRDHLVATPLYSLGLFALLLALYTPLGPARFALAGRQHARLPRLRGRPLADPPRPPRGRVACALRRHHLRHHFSDPAHNFGISSPLWDLAFRTWRSGPVREDS